MLHYQTDIPAGLLTVPLKEIKSIFPTPTVLSIAGRKSPPVFVSVLLHGNEDAGLLALQELLNKYVDRELPRSLIVFIGNVDACEAGSRYLSHQVDFNRAWPGSELPPCEIHEMLAEVTEFATRDGLFASVDVHNNTGRNPHYGCVCLTDPRHLYLASLFGRTVVYFTRPKGVQTQAFMQHCPSLTCECGKIGDRFGATRAAETIDACLHMSEFPDHALELDDIDVYHTVARIRVREHRTFGFEPGQDILLRADLDDLNFTELHEGESLGSFQGSIDDCFIVNDEHGQDVTHKYLVATDAQVRMGRSAMPSMFTRNLEVIRQDCLGYLMERYPLPSRAQPH